jgi:hypothetical protein|tara:strand:+ start:96 stop:1016 length:921 start_codon:yes stop_codon:yes gene_type:complete
MVEYICNRCGYSTKQKSHLLNHLNRKNTCQPLLEDISIEEVKKYYGFIKQQIKPVFEQEKPVFDSFSKPGKNQVKPAFQKNRAGKNQVKPAFSKKKIICDFCDKTFTRTYGLTSHLKKCKTKKNQELVILEKNNEIKELKSIVEKLLIENKGTTITNNTTNNTTNNIININNYGDEDTKYITSDYILKLLKNKPAKVIPELIKYTHFNTKHPENQNIKITNKKEPYIRVRKNDKWELQDRDETITDLIDRQQLHLMDENMGKKIASSCNNSEKVNIERCTDLYNEENKEYMKRLFNESELIIINNS